MYRLGAGRVRARTSEPDRGELDGALRPMRGAERERSLEGAPAADRSVGSLGIVGRGAERIGIDPGSPARALRIVAPGVERPLGDVARKIDDLLVRAR